MSNNQAIGQDDPTEEREKELEKKMEEKQALIREHETRLSGLRSNGLQLGNIYLVFQGVILTATASGAKVFTCNDSGLLITISVLAACPNLAALYLIGQEYIRTMFQRDKWLIYCDDLNTELQRLNNSGPRPDAAARTPPPEQTPTTGGTPQRGETSGPQPDPAARTPPEQTPTTGGTTRRGETSGPQPDPAARTPPEQTPTTGGTPQRGETSGPQPDPAARTPPEQTPTTGGTTRRGETSGPQPDPAARTPPEQTPTTGGTPQRGETSGPQPDPAARTPPPEQAPTTGGTPQRDYDFWTNRKRNVVLFGCMAFFLGVSAIMVFACRKILCRAVAGCKLPSSLSKNCIRLCDEGRSKCLTICRN